MDWQGASGPVTSSTPRPSPARSAPDRWRSTAAASTLWHRSVATSSQATAASSASSDSRSSSRSKPSSCKGPDLVAFGCRQGPLPGFDVGLDLFGTGGAGDDRGDLRKRQQPGERQLEHGVAPLLRPLLEPLDALEHLVGEVGREEGTVAGAGEACSLGQLLVAVVLAGQ